MQTQKSNPAKPAFRSNYTLSNLPADTHMAIEVFEEDPDEHLHNLKRMFSEFMASDEIDDLSMEEECSIRTTFRFMTDMLRGIKTRRNYNSMHQAFNS